MPGFNGTGPRGEGSMTGGGFGRCTGSRGSFLGRGAGRGFRSWGCGRGFAYGGGVGRGRNVYVEPVSMNMDDEKRYLNDELKTMQDEMEEMKKRLGELDND